MDGSLGVKCEQGKGWGAIMGRVCGRKYGGGRKGRP